MQTFELGKFLYGTLLPFKARAAKQGISLELVEDMASHVWLKADRRQIRELLDTVLLNTLTHSGASRIGLFLRQLLRTDREILLEFLLEDDGPPARGARRFAYFRALAHARRLIEALQGKSELVVTPGIGMQLRFVLKCEWKPAIADHTSVPHGQAIRGKHVLVAEDNEVNQGTIAAMLREQQVSFEVVANGKEAIDLLEKNGRFDLILMDLHMPYMDGFQTTNYIRKKLNSQVPILGMTPNSTNDNLAPCLQAGINQFIKKPFSARDLVSRLDSFFSPGFQPLDQSLALLQLKTI
ncbi:MAG TPA: response regulator [Flavisolibacter sp.]|nr:response regulator [Flavisolibacter sp.]